ncbi:hypothetical protein QE152_g26242 [Popillia japonica]|uniref:Uncharacterized protein n=1 Tax=Popillia japonica TaxID=7064 RepID=A0AAW1JZN1_POPJA
MERGGCKSGIDGLGCASKGGILSSSPLPTVCANKQPVDNTYCASRQFGGDPQTRFTRFILKVREPVAEYLERHGLPKNSQCSFVNLVTSLVQRAYGAGVTIVIMLANLFPLLDGFVYLLRFLLDKILEISQTKDRTEVILKSLLFLGELIILFLLVMMIFGLILMPVWALLGYVLTKFLGIATQVG